MVERMRQKPHCSKRTVIAKTHLFTVEQLQLTFANGAQRLFERIRNQGHGAVMIVPITADKSLLLVREYSAGTDSYELTFPKGLINAGETSVEAANRELQEEVGFAARQLTCLRSMTLAPGYFGAKLDIIVAQGLFPSVLTGDEPEPPEVVEWPLRMADQLLLREDFTEARSIAALFLVKDWLNKKENKNE